MATDLFKEFKAWLRLTYPGIDLPSFQEALIKAALDEWGLVTSRIPSEALLERVKELLTPCLPKRDNIEH